MVMPVATPMAKLMPNSIPQNRVMRFQISRPVITYTDSMITRIMDIPSVSGTNRKWYSAVRANCSRDRFTTVKSITSLLLFRLLRARVGGRRDRELPAGGLPVHVAAVRRREEQHP